MVGVQFGAVTAESVWLLLRKLEIDLLYDPTIPQLSIYTKDSISHYRHMCLSVFTDAPFTIVRTWKQPRCPGLMNG